MITHLKGTLEQALPTGVVVDVNGVGYEAQIPLSTFDKLPQPPAQVKLCTELIVREDAHLLFAFATDEERALFRLLTRYVSGLGPKTALAVLSGMPVREFRAAVVQNDLTALSRIKGLGKKTAEKMVVELRDKIGVSAAWEVAASPANQSPEAQKMNDAVLALIALGYKQSDAFAAVKRIHDDKPDADTETLIREALRKR